MLRSRTERWIAGLAIATLAVVGLISTPDDSDAASMPSLTVGQPLTSGDWSAEMCTPGPGGLLMIPPVRLSYSASFELTTASEVTVSIAPASQHPAAGPQIVRVHSATEYSWPTDLTDVTGQPAWAGINLGTLDPTGSEPSGSTVTADLSPGQYEATVGYAHCSGFFTISLDSVKVIDGGQVAQSKSVPLPVKAVKLPKKSIRLERGDKIKLPAAYIPANAKVPKLTWKSSNPKVAKVSKKGVIKARRPGKTTITVRAQTGKVAKLKVKVT
jgi:uncharacterized protein YjdB